MGELCCWLTYLPAKERASEQQHPRFPRPSSEIICLARPTAASLPSPLTLAELPAHVPQARQHPEKSDSCTYSRSKITPASTPSTTTHITAIMSQPSLAPYVMKRPWLMRWAQPLSKWYFDNAGYRKLGLRYERSGTGGGGHWVARTVQ